MVILILAYIGAVIPAEVSYCVKHGPGEPCQDIQYWDNRVSGCSYCLTLCQSGADQDNLCERLCSGYLNCTAEIRSKDTKTSGGGKMKKSGSIDHDDVTGATTTAPLNTMGWVGIGAATVIVTAIIVGVTLRHRDRLRQFFEKRYRNKGLKLPMQETRKHIQTNDVETAL